MKNPIIEILLRIGLVKRRSNGRLSWPIKVAPLWMWRCPLVTLKMSGWFYVFRNLPGVIKWREGRLLPIRWGFGIAGLIEFGDRG